MIDLGAQLLDLRVLDHKADEAILVELGPLEVGRPFAASLRVGEVPERNRPGRVDRRARLGEEFRGETAERIRARAARLEEPCERDRFLRRNGHPLSIDGIEAADRISRSG